MIICRAVVRILSNSVVGRNEMEDCKRGIRKSEVSEVMSDDGSVLNSVKNMSRSRARLRSVWHGGGAKVLCARRYCVSGGKKMVSVAEKLEP